MTPKLRPALGWFFAGILVASAFGRLNEAGMRRQFEMEAYMNCAGYFEGNMHNNKELTWHWWGCDTPREGKKNLQPVAPPIKVHLLKGITL